MHRLFESNLAVHRKIFFDLSLNRIGVKFPSEIHTISFIAFHFVILTSYQSEDNQSHLVQVHKSSEHS